MHSESEQPMRQILTFSSLIMNNYKKNGMLFAGSFVWYLQIEVHGSEIKWCHKGCDELIVRAKEIFYSEGFFFL